MLNIKNCINHDITSEKCFVELAPRVDIQGLLRGDSWWSELENTFKLGSSSEFRSSFPNNSLFLVLDSVFFGQ